MYKQKQHYIDTIRKLDQFVLLKDLIKVNEKFRTTNNDIMLTVVILVTTNNDIRLTVVILVTNVKFRYIYIHLNLCK